MKKIYRISDKIAIAAGGVTDPIEEAVRNIRLQFTENLDLSSLFSICKQQFSNSLNSFIARTPGIEYTTLYFLIGGISPSTNNPFLCACQSDHGFEPINYEPIQLVTLGDAHEDANGQLTPILESSPSLLNDKYFLIDLFAKTIADCSVNYKTTGADTYFNLITRTGFEEHFRE
jgi:hypothetical protein